MMARPMRDPIVFFDVDGTLIPFRGRPAEFVAVPADAAAQGDDVSGNPLLARLDPADGDRLLALGCQLAWATTRMNDANDLIAPRLGFPKLPVVEFPDDDEPAHGVALEDGVSHAMGGRAGLCLARR